MLNASTDKNAVRTYIKLITGLDYSTVETDPIVHKPIRNDYNILQYIYVFFQRESLNFSDFSQKFFNFIRKTLNRRFPIE